MGIFQQEVVGKVVSNKWIEFKGQEGIVAYREVLFSVEGETVVFRTTSELGEDWKVGQTYDLQASPAGEAKIKVPKVNITSARLSQGE